MKMSEVELKNTNKSPEAIFVWEPKMAQLSVGKPA